MYMLAVSSMYITTPSSLGATVAIELHGPGMLRETYSEWIERNFDCLEGGTHEETLRPQVYPKVKGSRFK